MKTMIMKRRTPPTPLSKWERIASLIARAKRRAEMARQDKDIYWATLFEMQANRLMNYQMKLNERRVAQ
jgi:hypothetical protein